MGPLMRQLALLRWIRRYCSYLGVRCEAWVITASEADPLAQREGLCALSFPSRERMRESGLEEIRYMATAKVWIQSVVSSLSPDILLVDGHPAGSMHELGKALELAKKKVLLHSEDDLEALGTSTTSRLFSLYDQSFRTQSNSPILIREREELLSRKDARRALGITSDRAVYITLRGRESDGGTQELLEIVHRLKAEGWHIVLSAGPGYNGPPIHEPGISYADHFLPMELLPGIDAAVSSGGYHSFYELMYVGIPTVFLPDIRTGDSRIDRVRKAEMAGAGRLAKKLREIPRLLEDPGSPRAARILAPRNGARETAAKILSTMLDKQDVQAAMDAITPTLLGTFKRHDATAEQHWRLLEILGGESPQQWKEKRTTIEDLRSLGIDVPDMPEEPPRPHGLVQRFLSLCHTLDLSLDIGIRLTQLLQLRFPLAHSETTVRAMEALLPAFSSFNDWDGVARFLHSLDREPSMPIEEFARDFSAWLQTQISLKDAAAGYRKIQGKNRSMRQVLQALRHGTSSEALDAADLPT
jgi:hypothetical protein